jgi:hypothetical protein
MALEIVGSGFGRTGTMTTKDALGILGFGPTHHMVEILEDPSQIGLWKHHMAGRPVDWSAVFKGYRSQVDFPGAAVWQDLLTAFPDARVIHTERPEDAWWASFNKTIGKVFRLAETLPLPDPIMDVTVSFRDGLIGTLLGDYRDRETAIAAYRANNARVRKAVPPDRLLVFDVAQGWKPLCAFLDVPVPDTPFPHHNVRGEFWDHFGGEPDEA